MREAGRAESDASCSTRGNETDSLLSRCDETGTWQNAMLKPLEGEVEHSTASLNPQMLPVKSRLCGNIRRIRSH